MTTTDLPRKAGRPKGKGPHGEATKPMRIPLSLLSKVEDLVHRKEYRIPLYTSKVQAGFPSPADENIDKKIDLSEHLIKHPATTFFVRATGDSMVNAGIHEGDLLIVDQSLEATQGKIVIAAIEGQLTVKRLCQQQGRLYLMPENESYPPIAINPEVGVHIWGVVTNVIHAL